jgi:hypothetical protein
MILLISAFQVARITGMIHQCLALSSFLTGVKIKIKH